MIVIVASGLPRIASFLPNDACPRPLLHRSRNLAPDGAGTGDGVTDPLRLRIVGAQPLERLALVSRRDDDAEATAHVEDLVHLLVADLAELADQLEDGWDRQRIVDLEGTLGL